MSESTEQRVCIKFCFKIGKTASETFDLLKIAYGDAAMGRTQVFNWFRQFKDGRTSIESHSRSGRPSTSKNEEILAEVRTMVQNDGRLTVREMAEEVGISIGSCHSILTTDLNMKHVSAKFVPRLLTEEQWENCIPKRNRDESEEINPKRHCTAVKENEWESFDDDNLLVYNRHGLKSNKVASYDMDGTLITTVSGRVFAKDINDWKLIFSQVPEKLKKLCTEGYKIVIFTNQLGVGKGKINVKEIQTKIMSVIEELGVPAQALVATGKGKYRKPITGMWDFFVEECNGGMDVDKDSSVYVGDAAGRPEIPKQMKKDHSVADRLFALNIGIPFSTPEEHFLDNKPSSYKMPDFIPSEIEASSLYNPVNTKVPKHPVEAILMVGFPGSGKSTFVEKNLLKLGYIPTNRDTLGTWQKCVSLMEKSLRDGKHVVIDNTNPDKASRKRYIEVAEKLNVPIRCFVLDISLNQSKHNNKFRELTGSNHSKVSDMIYNMYKSKFKEPTLKEGFSDIVKVNFVPSFKNSEMEEFYKTFLLEN